MAKTARVGRIARPSAPVPTKINDMRPYMDKFVAGMLHKLELNAHKKPPSADDVTTYILRIQGELLEVYEQWIKDRKSPNLPLELCDVANFAFLMFMVVKIEQEKAEK